MSIRTVHLVTRLNVGGIARFLAAARDAVDVLLTGSVGPGEREAPWQGPRLRVAGLGRSVRPADDLRALTSLCRTLESVRPDLLHTHASKAGALGRLAARRLGIPCVHTFHGHVLSGYFPRPVAWAIERLEAGLARWSRLTATGPRTAAELERRLGATVEVVAPGVFLEDAATDARRRWRRSLGNPALVALAVARPAGVKDLARFSAASRGAGYLPVVAGPRRAAGALALGHVERIQDLYAAADVVVCSSVAEGTPYSLMEAAWSGVPCVAPPVGDVAWVVGEGGLVTEDLEDGLRRLRDPDLRADLGRGAAAQVRRRFPAGALAPRLRKLYERVAAGY